MAQPTVIYASIPNSDPTAPLWLNTGGNLLPVLANPYSLWPSLEWTEGNIIPIYGENPQYLWSVSVPDPTDGSLKLFTRRFQVGNPTVTPSATIFPGGTYRLSLSICADNEYQVTLLKGSTVITPTPITQPPTPGFNSTVPVFLPWRDVKTYNYGIQSPLSFAVNDLLDIQIQARNVPLPSGTSNPAMFSFILQLYQT